MQRAEIPGQVTKIPLALWPKTKTFNRSNILQIHLKTLKIVHIKKSRKRNSIFMEKSHYGLDNNNNIPQKSKPQACEVVATVMVCLLSQSSEWQVLSYGTSNYVMCTNWPCQSTVNIFEVTFMLDSFTEILFKKNTIFKMVSWTFISLLYCRHIRAFQSL